MTQAEIKALIDKKITSNGTQEITGEVLNDVLQEIADACGYTFDIDVYPADAALEITFYNPDNPDGVPMKINAEVSNLGNSKLEAISAWWAAKTERKLNKTAGYDIDLTNVSTSPSTLGVTKVIEAGQIIQSFTGASKLIFGATDATNVTVNSTDLPYTATKTLYNVKLESGTAANLKITVANGIVSVSQNTLYIGNEPICNISGFDFIGVVPDTSYTPAQPIGKVFYIAAKGIYPNFGNQTLKSTGLLCYRPDLGWFTVKIPQNEIKGIDIENLSQHLIEINGLMVYLGKIGNGILWSNATAEYYRIINEPIKYISSITNTGVNGTTPELYIVSLGGTLLDKITLNTNNGLAVETKLDYKRDEPFYIFIGGESGCIQYKSSYIASTKLSITTPLSYQATSLNVGDALNIQTAQLTVTFNMFIIYEKGVVNNNIFKPYSQGAQFFQVVADDSFTPNSDANSVIDVPHNANSWAVIYLPTNYKADGVPCKLCLFMHGSSGSFTNETADANIECYAHGLNLIQNGYAVMDVSVAGVHMGGPLAMEMYRKAIDYVFGNYNVEHKIYLHGHSMGGLTALNFFNKFGNLVKVMGLWYPCLDIYNQGWLNTNWNNAKLNIPTFYNFADANVWEPAKVVGYNPIETNTITIDNKKYTFLNCPTKIWHGLADTTIVISYSEQYVESVKNAGGDISLRKVSGLSHQWSTVLETELLNWFNRY